MYLHRFLCFLFVAVMHAAIFGNVTAIIHGQYSSNFRYRKESLQINEFVRYFKIKNPLARRLRDYSRHTWSQTKGTDMAKVSVTQPLLRLVHAYCHATNEVMSDDGNGRGQLFVLQCSQQVCKAT